MTKWQKSLISIIDMAQLVGYGWKSKNDFCFQIGFRRIWNIWILVLEFKLKLDILELEKWFLKISDHFTMVFQHGDKCQPLAWS